MTSFEQALDKVLRETSYIVTISYRAKLSGTNYRVTVTDGWDYTVAAATCNTLDEVAKFLLENRGIWN